MSVIPIIGECRQNDDPELKKAAESFPVESRKKSIKDFICELINGEYDALSDYAEESISGAASDRAKRFLIAVFRGDEEPLKQLLSMDEGSRRKSFGIDKGEPWSCVIHGSIFETEGVSIRRKIVEAHRDLFESERIKDLEATVEGLRAQIVKLERRGLE